MKLSKRSGATLLLAVGASAIAGQAAASAAPATPVTPGQVAQLENGLATKTIPLRVPLETVTRYAPMLPLGGDVQGALPASPVLPPVPASQDQGEQGKQDLLPDRLVPPLNFSQVGPSLDTALPLPALDDGVRPGVLRLDSPQSPLHAIGPAVGVGHPLTYTHAPDGQPQDGQLAVGDLDPRLIPAAVSMVPGAKASLGGPDQHTSVVEAGKNLLATGAAALYEATHDQG
ncbi:hypothetical protein LN042_31910 [Kitasatospora sp. RB6PN24]|uniref:hypothetical protein n=1 Tax=Kitasatospora humi TaxID=2893891 RepID=UPI001E3B7B45|nr:hypothetical protein [Kitasatospora humi]MCC9311618.1 hypothetical protein [Kitasatospora humi]